MNALISVKLLVILENILKMRFCCCLVLVSDMSFGFWIVFYNLDCEYQKDHLVSKKDCFGSPVRGLPIYFYLQLNILNMNYKKYESLILTVMILFFLLIPFLTEKRIMCIMSPFLNEEDKWNDIFSFIEYGTFPLKD